MFSSKKAVKGSDGTTIIARGVVVQGDVHFAGNLHLEGTIEGSVRAEEDAKATFTLNAHGRVQGEISAPHAVIDGVVEGRIRCSGRLELAAGARIDGDIHYRVLEMAAGATVNGRMVHETGEPPRLTQQAAPDADESAAEALATELPAASA